MYADSKTDSAAPRTDAGSGDVADVVADAAVLIGEQLRREIEQYKEARHERIAAYARMGSCDPTDSGQQAMRRVEFRDAFDREDKAARALAMGLVVQLGELR